MKRFIAYALFAGLALPAQAAHPEAKVDCKAAGDKYVYDCMIRLSQDGKPLTGVEVTVGADMPTMPMAHSVKPAKAKPGKDPGMYHVRIELEMHGEWALKLQLSGAVRDLIVVKQQFGDEGSGHAGQKMQMK